MVKLNYDIVVIGAGPAGSTAARAAKKGDLRVLMIDKKRRVGRPVRCAEFVPKLLRRELEFDRRIVAKEVAILKTYMPGGEIIEMNSPGYLLDRELFDKELALRASLAGVDLLLNTKALFFEDGEVIAKSWKETLRIKAFIIIGADGPNSVVGTWMNRRNEELISAMQYEAALRERIDEVEVYFDFKYRGGYAWLFPKGMYANVGVGMNKKFGNKIKEALLHFMDRLINDGKIYKMGMIGVTGGLIPVGGYQKPSYFKNLLLVGDAAGQTNPITGAGLLQAVTCGRIAGEVASNAAIAKDICILEEYEVRWREIFGDSLDRALTKRKFLDAHWSDKQEFEKVVRESWITS